MFGGALRERGDKRDGGADRHRGSGDRMFGTLVLLTDGPCKKCSGRAGPRRGLAFAAEKCSSKGVSRVVGADWGCSWVGQ